MSDLFEWSQEQQEEPDANAHVLADLLMECETAYRLWKRNFPNDISLDRFIAKARVVLTPAADGACTCFKNDDGQIVLHSFTCPAHLRPAAKA